MRKKLTRGAFFEEGDVIKMSIVTNCLNELFGSWRTAVDYLHTVLCYRSTIFVTSTCISPATWLRFSILYDQHTRMQILLYKIVY